MKAEFVQNQWDGLIPGLQNNNYDVAINGIEITDDRKQEVNFTDPYYLTYEQLVVNKDREDINCLSDLVGKRAGALKGSLAERILQVPGIDVKTYDSEVAALTDMANGRLDAVLCDAPIALFYAKPDPRFKLVGQPIGEISYGIALRKNDTQLYAKLNSAINKLSSSGKLREILERWNLWHYLMAVYLNDKGPSNILPTKYDYYMTSLGKSKTFYDKLQRYWEFRSLFIWGIVNTLGVSIVAMILAIVWGLFIALTRLYAPKPLSRLAVLYIELIRGTPLLIQLYFIYYALPNIGISMSPFLAAVIGLGLNYAAYEAENYRAGLFSVPRGQMEAAVSLGMSRNQALKHIIIPQGIRLVIPPMTNDFISLLKDSSLIAVITMNDLTKAYFQFATTYFDFLGAGVLVAVLYLIIGLPFVKLAKYVEVKYSTFRTREEENRMKL